jgi:type VI secretion system protein ImpE
MTSTKDVVSAFNKGELNQSIDLATQLVKQQPGEVNHRNLLCELLIFRGEFARVDKQLETVTLQDTNLSVAMALFRQLLRAAMARQECFVDGRPPELLLEPTALIRQQLELWLFRREGLAVDLDRVAGEIEAARPRVAGSCNGERFEDFRDANDFTSFFFEVLTSTGKYYWIPFDTVESVEFFRPARPREALWCRARMIVRNGPDGEVYIPTVYLGSAETNNPSVQTGRAVDWVGNPNGCVQGLGQRVFLVGDRDRTLMDIQHLVFDQTAGG